MECGQPVPIGAGLAELGCCTCCGGMGADYSCEGACHDCRGTGHTHPWPPPVPVSLLQPQPEPEKKKEWWEYAQEVAPPVDMGLPLSARRLHGGTPGPPPPMPE